MTCLPRRNDNPFPSHHNESIVCVVEDCDRKPVAKGLCAKHMIFGVNAPPTSLIVRAFVAVFIVPFAIIFLVGAVSNAIKTATTPHHLAAWLGFTRTRRLTVYYPINWPQGEYHNCTTDPSYEWLNCSGITDLPPKATLVSGPTFEVFTMDVKFSGSASEQSWTCQNDNSSLTCKN